MTSVRITSFCCVAALVCLLPSPAHAAFVTLSGTVTDSNNVGIFGVTINLIDSCTGQSVGVNGNVTSATGTFSLTTFPGIYDVELRPAVGSVFTAKRIRSFNLATNQNLGQVILPNGVVVSGHVTDSAGVALSGVYLHLFPPGSSERAYTIHDTTDISGNYSFVVASGIYDLRYGPPAGTPYLALVVPAISIPGDTTLPAVALQTGFSISGTLTNTAGSPIINVNINAVDAATGAGITLSHDRSDANGLYSVEAPAGTYSVQWEPPPCTLLISERSAAVAVSADVTMPTQILPAGVLVEGKVTDGNGSPVVNVDTDYFTPSGVEVLTADDHTDSTGAFSTVITAGTYSIVYSPPRGLRLAGVELSGVGMTANPTVLPTVKLPSGYFVSGRVVTSGGMPVDHVRADFFLSGTSTQVYVSHPFSDSTGSFSIVSVAGTYDILFTPPAATGLSSVWRRGVVVSADVNLSDTVLPALPPNVTSVTPNAGTDAGGQTVPVAGTGFLTGAALGFGGVTATIVSMSGTSLPATTPAHPAGVTSATVTDPGGAASTMAAAYTFQEPAAAIALSVTPSGNDVVLTWSSTGQTGYTVFGSSAPTGWTNSSIITQTAATTVTVVGGAAGSGIEYFNVD